MTIVSSSIKITLHVRSFRPRFSPLLLGAQVSGRAANSCRGRFQRRPRRAIATLMLLTEALIP